MRNRVVVTGIGLITPLGPDRESSWRALADGRSATRRWTPDERSAGGGDVSGNPSPGWFGAPAVPPQRTGVLPGSEPTLTLALAAAGEALADAGLGDDFEPWRAGCVIGTSKGGLRSFGRALAAHRGEGDHSAADTWNAVPPSGAAATVAAAFRLRAAALAPVAACATGLVSINRGAELIRDGQCDLVLAGSSDASLLPAVLASFHRMGVLARGDDPAAACRPFDRRRCGFVVGEGAAVLVLERRESAAARGRHPYAEWLGGGLLSDPAGLTSLDTEATGLQRLIGDLLARCGVTAAEIDYINLHGTATWQNDRVEARGLRAALGAALDQISCSSLKGSIGHLLGAAGSVEVAATLLAMRDGMVPPTVNLEQPDPECALDCTPGTARPRPICTALKLSLGFGGHLAAALFREV